MSKFSEELNDIIRKRNGTIKNLTKDVGIERTLFHRVLKGERQLDSKDIDKLCDYLELTFEEKNRLLVFYEMGVVGEEKYNQRLDIKNIIESISQKLDMDNFVSKGDLKNVEINSNVYSDDIEVCDGKYKVEKFIKYKLVEISKSENTINCFIPFKLDVFYLTLQELFKNNNVNLKFNQLLMIDRSADSSKETLELIMQVLMMASVALENYKAHYFYSETKLENEFPIFMPYYFFTDTELVTISADLERVVLYKNKKIINLIKKQFDEKYNSSSNFINNISKHSDKIEERLNLVGDRLSDVRCIEPQPCFASFINKEFADKLIIKEIPYREEVINIIVDFYQNIEYSSDRKLFFTEDGLQNFVDKGIITVFPEEFVMPCSTENRIVLLKMIRDEIASKTSPLFKLIKSSRLFVSNALSIDSSNNGGTLFNLHDKEKLISIEILSMKINEMIIDYLDWLFESDSVYDDKQTVEILNEYIEKLKTKI